MTTMMAMVMVVMVIMITVTAAVTYSMHKCSAGPEILCRGN
jgi:hypothetical protein